MSHHGNLDCSYVVTYIVIVMVEDIHGNNILLKDADLFVRFR
jgi:hypothetical protein